MKIVSDDYGRYLVIRGERYYYPECLASFALLAVLVFMAVCCIAIALGC